MNLPANTKVQVTVGSKQFLGIVVNDTRKFAMQGNVREGQALVAVQFAPGKDGRKYFVVQSDKLTVMP